MLGKCAILVLCVAGCFAKFPSDVPQCKAADLECIVRVANEVIRKYPQGRPDLGLPAIDPFVIHNYNLNEHQSPDAPLSVNIFLKKAEIYGLSQSNFTKAVGWESNPNNSKHELYGTIPKLELKGQYKADGKVLLLPIKGEGDFHIVVENIKSGIKFKSYVVERDGHQYSVIKKVKCLLEPSSGKGKLTNLFDGNKELEDSFNDVINKSWKDAWDEISPGILTIAEDMIKDSLQKFFDIHEFDDFYLQ